MSASPQVGIPTRTPAELDGTRCRERLLRSCDAASVQHWNEMSSRWHANYARGRPSYPVEAVRVAGLAGSSVVLEVGAGTGKLTRVLVDEFAEVVAVEPDPHMRSWFSALCPRASLLAGMAEALPFASGSVDAVFVAEAFHWFDHRRALAEVARVLRPGGTLVLMWNRPAGTPEPPITAVERLLEPLWPKDIRSEERRVGKECRSRWAADQEK